MAYTLVLHKMIKNILNKITGTHLGLLLIVMFFATQVCYADDNILTMDQQGNDVIINVLQEGYDNSILVDLGLASGDSDNTFEVKQEGHNNEVFLSVGGTDNTLVFIQEGNNNDISWTDSWSSGKAWGGDLDGNYNNIHIQQKCSFSTCNPNEAQFHIWGNSNTVLFGQGYYLTGPSDTTFDYDNWEPGGNFLRLDIHGSSNSFKGGQKMDSTSTNHNMTVDIHGNSNNVFAQQWANGNKTLTLNVDSDSNSVAIEQNNSGNHTATVTLDGSYPTTMNLLQTGSGNQSYTIFQNCQTVGGCSISVTQQ